MDLSRRLRFHSTTMARVPGSSGDAECHREIHEEEKTTVKMDQGTTKTLEPGSPVIKKEKGSEDLQSPGRSSAIEVKAEEYEEKPKILHHLSSLKKTAWAIIISMVQGPQV